MKRLMIMMAIALAVVSFGAKAMADSNPPLGDSPQIDIPSFSAVSTGDDDGTIYQIADVPHLMTLPDMDGDGIPDVSDTDKDGDGVINDDDNCPVDINADQLDGDEDGVGDICDVCPEDADASHQDLSVCVSDDEDEVADTDGDGIADDEDLCPSDPADECASEYSTYDLDNDSEGTAGDTTADDTTADSSGGCTLAPGAAGNALSMLLVAMGLVPLALRRSNKKAAS